MDLRSLAVQGVLPPHNLGVLAQAKSLMHWHQRAPLLLQLRRSPTTAGSPAGGANARPAGRSISRAPTRW